MQELRYRSMEKFLMTNEGYEKLIKELDTLKVQERPRVIQAIADARAHGDLSENADYDAAREKQGFMEAKIKDLEAKLSRAEVVDPSKANPDLVGFGAYVTVEDLDTNDIYTYRIVSDYEADLGKKFISIQSPVARALLGKIVGDIADFNTPKGEKSYQIKAIKF